MVKSLIRKDKQRQSRKHISCNLYREIKTSMNALGMCVKMSFFLEESTLFRFVNYSLTVMDLECVNTVLVLCKILRTLVEFQLCRISSEQSVCW